MDVDQGSPIRVDHVSDHMEEDSGPLHQPKVRPESTLLKGSTVRFVANRLRQFLSGSSPLPLGDSRSRNGKGPTSKNANIIGVSGDSSGIQSHLNSQ